MEQNPDDKKCRYYDFIVMAARRGWVGLLDWAHHLGPFGILNDDDTMFELHDSYEGRGRIFTQHSVIYLAAAIGWSPRCDKVGKKE